MKITIEYDDIPRLDELLWWLQNNLPRLPDIPKSKVGRPMRFPRGVCRVCGEPLAKGSRSYCRQHETDLVRAWREKKGRR